MAELEIIRDTTAAAVIEDGEALPIRVLILEDGSARLQARGGFPVTRELRFSNEQRIELREALGA